MDGMRVGEVGGVGGVEALEPRGRASAQTGAGSFTEALGAALGRADALQREADAEAGRLALGGGNLHETALALEQADVAMRVLTKVRNRVVDAYQEVMRMSV